MDYSLLSLREKINDYLGSKFEFWKVSDVGGTNAFIVRFLVSKWIFWKKFTNYFFKRSFDLVSIQRTKIRIESFLTDDKHLVHKIVG